MAAAPVSVNPSSSSASKSGVEIGVNSSKVFNFGAPPLQQSLGGLLGNPLILGGVLVAVGFGLYLWLHSRHRK